MKFTLRREVNNGQSHVVVGNHPALGAWKVEDAPHMTWNDGHVWSTEVLLPPGTTLEFKVSKQGLCEPVVQLCKRAWFCQMGSQVWVCTRPAKMACLIGSLRCVVVLWRDG